LLQAVIVDLKLKETSTINLEEKITSLPPDEESQNLAEEVNKLKLKINSLQAQACQGQEAAAEAERKLARQQAELEKYNSLLTGLENWGVRAKEILLTSLEEQDVVEIQGQIRSHEVRP
jgi:uncharacterized coiled-coil DUF342 family protein